MQGFSVRWSRAKDQLRDPRKTKRGGRLLVSQTEAKGRTSDALASRITARHESRLSPYARHTATHPDTPARSWVSLRLHCFIAPGVEHFPPCQSSLLHSFPDSRVLLPPFYSDLPDTETPDCSVHGRRPNSSSNAFKSLRIHPTSPLSLSGSTPLPLATLISHGPSPLFPTICSLLYLSACQLSVFL